MNNPAAELTGYRAYRFSNYSPHIGIFRADSFLLFGIEYQSAGILLALMSSRLFFTNMGVARGTFILTENLMKFSLMTTILGTIANIGLNYLWIREYGAVGAIIATIISFGVTIFLIDILYIKQEIMYSLKVY